VEQALDTARAVLRANSRVLKDPAPIVGLARFVATGVTLVVAPWVPVADYGPAGGEINRAILAAFNNRKLLRSAAVIAAA
jgi:small conductance mechanosensitive channel